MSIKRLSVITLLTLLAFAGNSLLCRMALSTTDLDAASFTSIRLCSGALALVLLVGVRDQSLAWGGNWLSAVLLFIYAAGFSFAYLSLSAATGALLLFGAVQATMIGYGLGKGEQLNRPKVFGLILALFGLMGLLLPGLTAPPLLGAMLMLGAGVAWGGYSLRGRGWSDPTQESTGNFIRTLPMVAVLQALLMTQSNIDLSGVGYAMASGVLASGMGYALWYSVLPYLRSSTAAILQLSVPVLAALGGVVFLKETISLRILLSSITLLGGIAVFLLNKQPAVKDPSARKDAKSTLD
jgi:drug/metabolite transporter (DMT)-like permease